MISAINTMSQTVEANENISLGYNEVSCGCTVSHDAGSAYVSLNKNGIYYVEVGINASTVSTTGGTISVAAYRNGSAISGAVASQTVTTGDDVIHITLVVPYVSVSDTNTCCCCNRKTDISIVNIGDAATITNVSANVRRIA